MRTDPDQAVLGHTPFSEGITIGKGNGELLLARLGSCCHIGGELGYEVNLSHARRMGFSQGREFLLAEQEVKGKWAR